MRVATEGKITVCGTVTGSVELEQARDVRDTLDGARASNLVVENETAVLEHAVGYLSLPGHTDETASRVMPLVRFPLVSLLPPSAGAQCIMLPPSVHRQLKAMQERNEVAWMS